jgi:hypothetical protein
VAVEQHKILGGESTLEMTGAAVSVLDCVKRAAGWVSKGAHSTDLIYLAKQRQLAARRTVLAEANQALAELMQIDAQRHTTKVKAQTACPRRG